MSRDDHLSWTPRTWALAAFGVAGLLAGAVAGRMAFTALAATLLVLLAVEALLVGRGMSRVALHLTPERVSEGQRATVRLEVAHALPDAQVRVELDPVLAVVEGDNVGDLSDRSFQVTTAVRGPHRIGPVSLRRWSPLRLWLRETELHEPLSLDVVPTPSDVKQLAIFSRTLKPLQGRFQVNRPGQGFDFFALRQYAPGDTIRDVNWKASARGEELIVNQRQRETLTEMVILIDSRLTSGAGIPGQSPLDRSCRIALAVYAAAVRSHDITHLRTYGEGLGRLPRGEGAHACEAFLAHLPAGGSTGLAEAWEDLVRELRGTGPILVLSSMEAEDAQATHAFADMRARGHPVTLVSPVPEGPTWESPGAHNRRRDREAALEAVRGLGVVVADWKVGQALQAERPRALGAVA